MKTNIPSSSIAAHNVSSVPHRSPLRYPGGKTWLVPHVKHWLRRRTNTLYEPFCGGGIVSLTAAAENLADQCLLTELDPDVAAFWRATFNHTEELCNKIEKFEPTTQNLADILASSPKNDIDRGFRTLVLNRTRRGGILAAGTSFIRAGEDGKGVASRWYRDTLVNRLHAIKDDVDRKKLEFHHGDGMSLLESMPSSDDIAIFIDPPYTAGGKRPGRRLYKYHKINHKRLFALLADKNVDFLMTYNMTSDIVDMIRSHGFIAVRVSMKTTHHARVDELIVTRRHVF